MCNWLITGVDREGSGARSRELETEADAKRIAASWISLGTTDVKLWERRYAATPQTHTLFTAPNGRTEVFEIEPEVSSNVGE